MMTDWYQKSMNALALNGNAGRTQEAYHRASTKQLTRTELQAHAAGVALIIGWNARWVELALTPVLISAAITHWPNGWVHVSAGGGWEYPVFLNAASITLGLIGNGAWALETGSGRISMPRKSNQRAGI